MVACEPSPPLLHAAASDEESRLHALVTEDSRNFGAWTALIAEIEKTSQNDIQRISSVYDSFLFEFPLCYGYWKKYAEHTARLSSVEEAVEVYERGVQSATYSVGLWASYSSFGILAFEDPVDVRRLFERGLTFVGKDYLCYLLWDRYLEFEYSRKEWARVAYIYIRILRFPTKKLGSYYESFKKLVLAWEEEVQFIDSSSSELLPEALPDGDTKIHMAYQDPDVLKVIKDLMDLPVGSLWKKTLKKYLRIGEYFYESSSHLNAKISCFEICIRRPYFHVKLLDDSQLQNWHQYLDFVETLGDFDWTVKLYERCLIPCASYPEFWIRYVELMEEKGGRELANLALARATQTFVKTVPEIHLFCARYKERIGDIFGARAAFQRCSSDKASEFIENVKRHANMERRLGNVQAALVIYKKALELAKEMQNSQTASVLFVHFFQFTYMVTGDVDSARDILISGLQYLPHSKLLLEELIHFEKLHGRSRKKDVVDSIVAQATSPGSTVSEHLSAEDREQISSLFLELADLHGTIHEIKEAWVRHQKLFPYLLRPASFCKNVSGSDSIDKAEVSIPYNAIQLEHDKRGPSLHDLNQQNTTHPECHQDVTCEMPSNASGSDSIDKAEVSIPCKGVDLDNRGPSCHDLNQQNTTHPESLQDVTSQMPSNVSNNGSNERLNQVGLKIVEHGVPKLDVAEESVTISDAIHKYSTDSQTLQSSREILLNENLRQEDSGPPDPVRPPPLETLSIDSPEDKSPQSICDAAHDSRNLEAAPALNANWTKDTDVVSNLMCMHPDMPSQSPAQSNSDSSPARDLSLSKRSPVRQHQISSSGSVMPHDSTDRDNWHQVSFLAQPPGKQESQEYAQASVQHPQHQWQASPRQHFSQAEVQSQKVIPNSYPYQQPQTWQDPHTQQIHQMQNLYPVGPAQAYPGGAYAWPSQDASQPVTIAPQSQPSGLPVAQVQAPACQYPVQHKEQFTQMHSNQGYDPQLWQYYQQQQQLLLQQQQLLLLQQQQQQQLLMTQQQQQQQQQQPPQMSLMQQQQMIQQQQHQQHPLIAQQQQQMQPKQHQMTLSHVPTWNNYNSQQALPLQYHTSTQYRQEYSQQAVGAQTQVQVTLTDSGAAATPVYQQQQAPFIP
ncbi:pre-mRNA-processing factor 39-2 [Aristolochia californica]|uniref:pre-mRNA-processing factor 39-2 n=1 Tax=Aristolochia californica TaxID=171875 RepID=UPI0035DDF940